MKTISKIILLLFFIPLVAFVNPTDQKHKKSKKIYKTFVVNEDALVAITNKYGNLQITTWNKNKVEIEVTITVKGDHSEDVERKLEKIQVEFDASKSKVEATTIFEQSKSRWSWWSGNNNLSYKVNYLVKMPESNSVELNNDYGNIYLDKLSGKAAINCDYGKIELGELHANNNRIRLDYASSSSIDFMKSGTINADYSKLSIEDGQDITINADYTTLDIHQIQKVTFNVDYGAITIDKSEEITGNSDYTALRFGIVQKALQLDADYGSIRIDQLQKGFENVDISGEYTGIRVGIDPAAVFDFEIDIQYANFKQAVDQVEIYKSISKPTKKYYQGKFGKGSTKSTVKIKSQYGSVKFSESN
jgi:hypothetical protein